MRLAITGQAGTNGHAIASAIAERLGLDFVSVESVLDKNGLHVLNKHEDIILDKAVDADLRNTLSTLTDYCVYCDSAKFISSDAVTILITSQLISEQYFPKSLQDKRNCVQSYIRRDYADYVYVLESYDISVDITGVEIETVVENIIEAIKDDYRGKMMPARLVLPTKLYYVTDYLTNWDKATEFQLQYIRNGPHLLTHHNEYRIALLENSLIRYNAGRKMKLTRLTLGELLLWEKYCACDLSVPIRMYMLNKFCEDNGFKSAESAYVALYENGDPWKRLTQFGYTY